MLKMLFHKSMVLKEINRNLEQRVKQCFNKAAEILKKIPLLQKLNTLHFQKITQILSTLYKSKPKTINKNGYIKNF